MSGPPCFSVASLRSRRRNNFGKAWPFVTAEELAALVEVVEAAHENEQLAPGWNSLRLEEALAVFNFGAGT